jgi:hypothetical protein
MKQADRPLRFHRRRLVLPPDMLTATRTPDRREVARFLREQPPMLVPRSPYATPLPGLIALSVLGYRVIRRYQD